MFNHDLKYLFLIIVIFIAACIETDIYLPAFPDMMNYFAVTEEDIQALLSWNFIGICLAGPFYGPLSDAIGRKKPLLYALGLFFIGSIITIYAESFSLMLLGRFLQGLGSGGCFTLGSAVIFDAFQETKAVLVLNQLNTIIPIIMAGAPLAGGYLNETFGFRANFLVIAIFVLLSLVITLFFFKETLPIEKRVSLDIRKIGADFKKVLLNGSFWQLTTLVSVMFAGYIAFLSASSLLFVLELGVSKQLFPWFQAALLGAWLLGSLSMNSAVNAHGVPWVKKVGMALLILGGIIFGLSALLVPQNPYYVTLGIMVFAFGANWTQGFYFQESMEIFPDIKGITSSLITSARLLITSIIVGLAGVLYNGTIYPLAFIILAIVIVSVFLIILYEKKVLISQRGST